MLRSTKILCSAEMLSAAKVRRPADVTSTKAPSTDVPAAEAPAPDMTATHVAAATHVTTTATSAVTVAGFEVR